jgi:ribosomal protein L12E/L44/L45/RPP1/RPP2
MSDNYTDDDFDSDDIETTGDTGDIKSLRRAASSKKKLEQELNELKRELAFARAGISMDDPKLKYFVRGYDGELSAEAIREAALEAGFLASQSQGEDPNIAAAGAAQQRVMAASSGVQYEGMSEEAALAQLEAAMEEGGIEALLDVARQFGIPTHIDQ